MLPIQGKVGEKPIYGPKKTANDLLSVKALDGRKAEQENNQIKKYPVLRKTADN